MNRRVAIGISALATLSALAGGQGDKIVASRIKKSQVIRVRQTETLKAKMDGTISATATCQLRAADVNPKIQQDSFRNRQILWGAIPINGACENSDPKLTLIGTFINESDLRYECIYRPESDKAGSFQIKTEAHCETSEYVADHFSQNYATAIED